MDDKSRPIPFGQRIDEELARRGSDWNASRLARESGISESIVSRVRRGERAASHEVIEAFAGVFGVEAGQLVAGTDAEERIAESQRMIRREHFDALRSKLIEMERRATEAEAQAARWRDQAGIDRARFERAAAEAEGLRGERDRLGLELEDARRDADAQRTAAGLHWEALQRAVQEVTDLRQAVREMGTELQAAHRTSRFTAVMAGIAALPVIATAADYLWTDEAAPRSRHADDRPHTSTGTRRKSKRPRRS